MYLILIIEFKVGHVDGRWLAAIKMIRDSVDYLRETFSAFVNCILINILSLSSIWLIFVHDIIVSQSRIGIASQAQIQMRFIHWLRMRVGTRVPLFPRKNYCVWLHIRTRTQKHTFGLDLKSISLRSGLIVYNPMR